MNALWDLPTLEGMPLNSVMLEIEDLFQRAGYPHRFMDYGSTSGVRNNSSSFFQTQIPKNVGSKGKKRRLPCPFEIEESQYSEPIGVSQLESGSTTAWPL